MGGPCQWFSLTGALKAPGAHPLDFSASPCPRCGALTRRLPLSLFALWLTPFFARSCSLAHALRPSHPLCVSTLAPSRTLSHLFRTPWLALTHLLSRAPSRATLHTLSRTSSLGLPLTLAHSFLSHIRWHTLPSLMLLPLSPCSASLSLYPLVLPCSLLSLTPSCLYPRSRPHPR